MQINIISFNQNLEMKQQQQIVKQNESGISYIKNRISRE